MKVNRLRKTRRMKKRKMNNLRNRTRNNLKTRKMNHLRKRRMKVEVQFLISWGLGLEGLVVRKVSCVG